MTTLATETWTGTNGAAWPAQWTTSIATGGAVDIQGNAGRMRSGTAGYAYARGYLSGMAAATDLDVVVSWQFTAANVEQYLAFHVSADNTSWSSDAFFPQNGYTVQVAYAATAASSRTNIYKTQANTQTNPAVQVTRTLVGTTNYSIRIQRSGSTVRYRLWDSAVAEPSSWDSTWTDPSTPLGAGRLLITMSNGSPATQQTATLDNLTVTDGADTTAPTVPTGVTATANNSTSVTVSWTASTDAVGVASYRVRQGGVDVVGATAVAGTSFVVTGLAPSTAYSFTVSAVDAAGNRSAESTAATVTTPAAPPPPVTAPGVDSRLYDVLRGPHTSYGYIEAWRGGSIVTFDGDTRLPMVDGSVEVDGSTPGVRRTLSASFAPIPGLFDALAPTGTELRAFSVIRPPNGATQVTAQGVLGIDAQRMGYASNGDIRVTAPDRWKRVQDSRFLVPRASMAGATVRAQIAALLNEVMPSGVTTVDLSTSTATVPAQVWDRDRDKAIEELAKAASLDVFFDRNGAPTIRDAPAINPENVSWVVDAGELGVMVSAERERNRQRTFNVVVINGTPNEGVAPFPTQFVWDNDPNSPTYAGPDPVNHPELAGPFGVRPTFYSSPLLRDISQALVAGHTILERVMGLESQLTLTTVPKPDLDDGATVLVKLPPEYPRGPIPLELHVVDRMTVPLRPSKNNPLTISTRSTLAGYEGAE